MRQHELTFCSWGGARRGAGRKPVGERPRVSHEARPALAARHPVHVTTRVRSGLPNLRVDAPRRAIERSIACASARHGVRIVPYSIQRTHVHLVVEALDRHALSRAMRALAVRVARALNALWRRAGAVFDDRFHSRILRTPREVRSVLVYVLQNARHHGLCLAGVDPCSSGAWFDGWKQAVERASGASPCAGARSWLLRVGWRRHGRIGVDEPPAIGRSSARLSTIGERDLAVRGLGRSLGRAGIPR